MNPSAWIWAVSALAAAGLVTRPFRWPEAVWAVSGAAVLAGLGLLPVAGVIQGLEDSVDVCLFLAGMMLLSEIARLEGLFDWIAAMAVNRARGSPGGLFLLVYLVGVGVTALLSNDATAVVLTPAVLAVARAAGAEPAPLLFACAFVANAASFLLPISNPANLVLFGGHVPPLAAWMTRFGAPSLLSIGATFGVLRWRQARGLGPPIAHRVPAPRLGAGARIAAVGLTLAAMMLLIVSALDLPLGLPTFIAGGLTSAIVLVATRRRPQALVRGVSWDVLALVAGLFVLVQAVERTGLIARLVVAAGTLASRADGLAGGLAGLAVALGGNLINNLPMGLLARSVVAHGGMGAKIADAMLIGVDLGPNLSITGSLASLLWLASIRREGLDVSAWRFLRLGVTVAPPALLLALGARLVGP